MAATAAQLQTAITAAQLQLAALDLATLQAFQTVVISSDATRAQIAAALVALPGQLGSPRLQARAADFVTYHQGLTNFLAATIAEVQDIVTPPENS